MLIICTGPETFLARQKVRDLVSAYRQKHDPSGTSIENLEQETSLQDALAKLGNLGLFAAKKLLKYENLLAGITASQIKQLSKALISDANQTIVLTYEDKAPTKKTLESFPKELLFVYQYEELNNQELAKWIVERCRHYGLTSNPSQELIRLHGSNLWAIETSLQMLRALGDMDLIDRTHEAENQVFSVIDDYFKQNQTWREKASTLDAAELLPLLMSQLLNWHKIKFDQAQGVHPFVQKKLSSAKLIDAEEKTLDVMRALYASRSSLSQNQEIVQIF